MSEKAQSKNQVKWYIFSLFAGAVISSVLILLPLKYYVSIDHPCLVFFSAIILSQLFIFAVSSGKVPQIIRWYHFVGRTAISLLAGVVTFYGLMALYPPNFS